MTHYLSIIEDYAFSNICFPMKEVHQIGKITIDQIFSTVSTIISSPMKEAQLPELTDF